MSADKKSEPEKKEFYLKKNESMMMQVMNQQHMIVVANFLTFIALERWGYPADELTQYEIAPDLTKVLVWQKEPEAKPDEPKPVEKNTTADAIKKGE